MIQMKSKDYITDCPCSNVKTHNIIKYEKEKEAFKNRKS